MNIRRAPLVLLMFFISIYILMSENDYQFEICANSVESCLAAQAGGANRVELCAGIPEGGTTPSYGDIKMAREHLNKTRLHVIIRPRGGDFLYSPLDIKCMLADIDICQQLGVDGVVFGCLTKDGGIDIENNQLLLSHAKGMSTTFHRAFDRCKNPFEALEQLIELGFDRILTSGQQPTAEQGIEMLKQLQDRAQGRINILAGCGINETNIAHIAQCTLVKEFHFSARESVYSQMEYHNPSVYMGMAGQDEMTTEVTTERRVRNTIQALLHSTR